MPLPYVTIRNREVQYFALVPLHLLNFNATNQIAFRCKTSEVIFSALQDFLRGVFDRELIARIE